MKIVKENKHRSPAHRAYVASLPCLIAGFWNETNVDHHLLRAGGHSTGSKACDSLTVPLQHFYHDRLHANGDEIAFFANHGWDYLRLLHEIKKINANSPVERIRSATAIDDAIKFYSR